MASIKTENSNQDINVYAKSLSVDSLHAIRRQLAKRANQRMVRLERAKSKVTGESYDFGAIEKAREYLNGKRRFNEKLDHLGEDNLALKREISILQNFLNSKSSTVQGMREIEKTRIESFEKGEWGQKWNVSGIRNHPIKFASNKEFYNFLNSGVLKDMDRAGYDSDQAIEIFSKASELEGKSSDEIVSIIKKKLKEFRETESGGLKDILKAMGLKKIT